VATRPVVDGVVRCGRIGQTQVPAAGALLEMEGHVPDRNRRGSGPLLRSPDSTAANDNVRVRAEAQVAGLYRHLLASPHVVRRLRTRVGGVWRHRLERRVHDGEWASAQHRARPRALRLRGDLLSCRTPAEALDVAEVTLRTPEPFDRDAFARCEAAVAQLSADPTRTVVDIATELGVSHGHLDRQFTEHVGLSPRTFARILRMRRLLEEIEVYGSVGCADKAAELGWSARRT
jgi:AraC-like DNA-binding protein